MNRNLVAHPVAALFPDMPPADFAALVEDIRQNGVRVPILVYRGQILDGRQRYRACKELGRPCPVQQWNGRNPWLEVQSRNLVRRHLAKDQVYALCKIAANQFPELVAAIDTAKAEAKKRQVRKPQATASAAASPKPLLRSQDRNKESESADAIGSRFGVSGTTVKRVDRLAREAPELVRKVAAGELSVKKALLQVAITRDPAAAPTRSSPQMFHSERDVRKLQRTIKAVWSRCPSEHRPAVLYALQNLLRELIAEHTGADSTRSTATSFDRPNLKAV